VSDDTEVWLLFAPFWLLGLAALIGAIWHMTHAARYTRRANSAVHEPKKSLYSKRLAKHHLGRGLIALTALLALFVFGMAVGVLAR
jgi:hypothetical protein